MDNFFSLIIGDVRNELAFKDAIVAAKSINDSCGGKGKIIISTWSDKKPLAEKLIVECIGSFSGIEVIYSSPLAWDMPGNWIRQACLLESGLDLLSDSDWVLKMRTDKTDWVTGLTTAWQKRDEIDSPKLSRFEKRILILEALPSEPFFYADMVFGGLASDLRKIIPRSLAPVVRSMIINAEQAFFSAPFFFKQWEWVYKYFCVNDGLPHGQSQAFLGNRYSSKLGNTAMLAAIAGSLVILRDLYWMPASFAPTTETALLKDAYSADQVTLHDYFCGAYTPQSPFSRFDLGASNCQAISSLAGIDSLLNMPISYSCGKCLMNYVPKSVADLAEIYSGAPP